MRVPRQPLKLLEILLERPGKVFTRGGIAKARLTYKKESSGDFDQAVNVAIAKLRSALEILTEPLGLMMPPSFKPQPPADSLRAK
jgi:DNA-binding response OmpR family regulator